MTRRWTVTTLRPQSRSPTRSKRPGSKRSEQRLIGPVNETFRAVRASIEQGDEKFDPFTGHRHEHEPGTRTRTPDPPGGTRRRPGADPRFGTILGRNHTDGRGHRGRPELQGLARTCDRAASSRSDRVAPGQRAGCLARFHTRPGLRPAVGDRASGGSAIAPSAGIRAGRELLNRQRTLAARRWPNACRPEAESAPPGVAFRTPESFGRTSTHH